MSYRSKETAPDWDSDLAKRGYDAWTLLSSLQDLVEGHAIYDPACLGECAIDQALLVRNLSDTHFDNGEWSELPAECRDAVMAAAKFLLEYAPWTESGVTYLSEFRPSRYPPGLDGNATPHLMAKIEADSQFRLLDDYGRWLGLEPSENRSIDRLGLQSTFVKVIAIALNEYVPDIDSGS